MVGQVKRKAHEHGGCPYDDEALEVPAALDSVQVRKAGHLLLPLDGLLDFDALGIRTL